MFAPMIIVFREIFEIILILVPIASYIKSTRGQGLKKYLIGGISSGISLILISF